MSPNIELKSLSSLPLDILREISEYTDTVYWCKRTMKFITRFSKRDKRYELLKKITAPIYAFKRILYVRFGEKHSLTKHLKTSKHYDDIRFYDYEYTNGYRVIYETYTFYENGKTYNLTTEQHHY